MKHKDCGGEIVEDWKVVYTSVEHGTNPRLLCCRCDTEILGEAQIEFDDPLLNQ